MEVARSGFFFWVDTYLTEAAVEYVERAVVRGGAHVLDVVLHLHLDAVAVVVFAALELLVAVLLGQPLERPLVAGPPPVLHALDHDRLVDALEPLDELPCAHLVHVDALHVVLELAERLERLMVAQLHPC